MPFASPQDEQDARCLGCGHPLAGLAAPTCPECGRGFVFDQASTWGRASTAEALARHFRAPPGSVFTLVIALCGVALVLLRTPLTMELPGMLAAFGLTVTIAGLLLVRVAIAVAGRWRSWHVTVPATPGSRRRWGLTLVLGVGSLVAAHSGVPSRWMWRYNEPILRAEAERVLAGPLVPVGWNARRFGTISVMETTVDQGRVHFLTDMSVFLSNIELIYSPPGVPVPALPPGGRDLGDGWTLTLRDMF